MAAITAIVARWRTKPVPIALNNGRPARFRFAQSLGWGVFVGACGAAWVAGLYFNVLQVPWHLVGSPHVYTLKHWWDGGMGVFHSPSWKMYRHGERDLGEPAVATLAVRTLLANRKLWEQRIGAASIIARGVAVLALAVALIAGAVWLINFGAPPLASLPFSAANLAAGFVIGQVLHRIWAPAGATLQGMFMDRAADRARLNHRIPLWIRWPVVPLQLRERFVTIMEHDADIRARSNWLRYLLPIIGLVTVYLVVTGFIAHYYIGSGHAFPYLAP